MSCLSKEIPSEESTMIMRDEPCERELIGRDKRKDEEDD